MAERTARDPQGHDWTIRERWMPLVGGLPPNAAADAFDGGGGMPWEIFFVPFGLAWSLICWIARLPLAAFGALFLPPWIEAARETGPPIQMTWRARNRFVGPRVIEAIAAKIERGDLTTAVDDARFEGFGS